MSTEDLYVRHPDMLHIPRVLAQPMGTIADAAGSPADQIRFVLCLVASLPIGFLYRRLPAGAVRHAFGLALGLFYVWFVTGPAGVYHPLISSTIAYFLMKMRVPPSVVSLFMMMYLSWAHIYRQVYHYLEYNLDFSTPQMMITIKLCMMAYNHYDGYMLKKTEKLSKFDRIHNNRVERAIDGLPNLLEYYSYVFFYGGILAGPTFEIKEYLDFVDDKLEVKGHPKDQPIPSALLPALSTFGRALVCYGGIMAANMYFPVPEFYGDAQVLAKHSLLYRLAYLYISLPLFRFKYYFAWYLSEAGCIATGLGFNGYETKQGKDGSKQRIAKWDRVNNVSMFGNEFATNMSDLTSAWNKTANNWLKNYVYFRAECPKFLSFIGQATFGNIVTKLTSAFWHGFYPGYYMFFLGAVPITLAEAQLSRVFRGFFYDWDMSGKKPKLSKAKSAVHHIVWSVIAWIFLLGTLNFIGVAFILLEAHAGWAAWKALGFVPMLGAIGCTVVLGFLPSSSKKPTAKVFEADSNKDTKKTK
jgi:lysophospholipid acyltransferase